MRGRTTSLLVTLVMIATACAGSTEDTTTTAEISTTATTTAEATTTTAAEASTQTEVVIGLQLEPPTLDLTSSPRRTDRSPACWPSRWR
jgi:hypothetical protein